MLTIIHEMFHNFNKNYTWFYKLFLPFSCHIKSKCFFTRNEAVCRLRRCSQTHGWRVQRSCWQTRVQIHSAEHTESLKHRHHHLIFTIHHVDINEKHTNEWKWFARVLMSWKHHCIIAYSEHPACVNCSSRDTRILRKTLIGQELMFLTVLIVGGATDERLIIAITDWWPSGASTDWSRWNRSFVVCCSSRWSPIMCGLLINMPVRDQLSTVCHSRFMVPVLVLLCLR